MTRATRADVVRDVDVALRAYANASEVAVDLETSGLRPEADDVLVVSLAARGLPTAVLHVHGSPPPELVKLLNSKRLVGHNVTTFDVPFLAKYGYDPLRSAGWDDTLLLEQLCLTSGRADLSKSLQATLKRRLNVVIEKSVDHAGWSSHELTDEQVRYAAEDVDYLLRLRDEQLRLLGTLCLWSSWRVEREASRATATMVVRGVPVVAQALRDYVRQARVAAEGVREECAKILGPINPASPKQVVDAFARRFGIKLSSSDDETMASLSRQPGDVGRAAALVREYRQLKKVQMYDEEWVEKHVSSDGRVRSKYWQIGTDTGRYSCTDPNLQQWPRRMRQVVGFQPDDGRVILSADYSQIEVLIAGDLFRERRLVEAVLRGDVHRYVASLLFGVEEGEVTDEQRAVAKAASFTLLFAGGKHGLNRALGGPNSLSDDQADRVIASFYRSFPKAWAGIESIRSQVRLCKEQGRALRVRVPGGPVRSLYGEKLTPSTAVNTLVQGMAAAGLKASLVKLVQAGLGEYLCAVVHDEVVLDVPERIADEAAVEVKRCMAEGMEGLVGVRPGVKIHLGLRWE